MSSFQFTNVRLRFQLSDWTMFSLSIPLQVRQEKITSQSPAVEVPSLPNVKLEDTSQGFLVRGLQITESFPLISDDADYIHYVSLKYQHFYIDLDMSFEKYKKKFSSKTRSTLNRKVKKYTEYCDGVVDCRTYSSPDDMRDFFHHACAVSKKTYQEKLFDGGIPCTEEFILQAESLAANQCVRAYILFDGDRPVSYLYCPVKNGVLIYSYLGYDPEYMKMSVGTVLQWIALERLFGESCFRYFDFTEGESAHKRLFATNHLDCANVFMVKKGVKNKLIIYGHMLVNRFSRWLGMVFEHYGIKSRIKHILRFS